jgi:hypothetical protein
MACALLLNDDRDDYGFFQGDKLDKKKTHKKKGEERNEIENPLHN